MLSIEGRRERRLIGRIPLYEELVSKYDCRIFPGYEARVCACYEGQPSPTREENSSCSPWLTKL